MRYEIGAAPLEIAPLIAAVAGPENGAIVTFLGVVRADDDPEGTVEALVYEAYEELALSEMRAIGAEASTRFGPARVAIAHRTGAWREQMRINQRCFGDAGHCGARGI